MHLLFKEKELEKMYYEDNYVTKRYHPHIIKEYRETVFLLQSIRDIQGAWKYRSLNVEKYQGKYSARVTKGWRIIFSIDTQEILTILMIEKLTNHYE